MSSETGTRPRITPKPDGPYLVQGVTDLRNQKGPIETKPVMALCRCGRSNNKPFCDGTHAKVGFSSAKSPERTPDKLEAYEGEGITIRDNRGVCAHAGRCTDGLPSVFRLKQEPWIDPQAAGADQIVAVIRQCPSGALSYTRAGSDEPAEKTEPAVMVTPNGPYVVTGGPELADTEPGEGASSERFTLCRCGGSRNKPFCDGTHWHNGFTDDKN